MAKDSETCLWIFRSGIGFILLASLLFLLGFCTTNWFDNQTLSYGLWEQCEASVCQTLDSSDYGAYFVATQVFQAMALAAFILAPILHFLFYCSKDSVNGWRTRIFDVCYSIGILFHFISIVVFGVEHPTPSLLSWSFSMSASANAIGFIGILLVIFSRKDALQKFGFLPNHRRGHRTARVGVNATNFGTPQFNGKLSVASPRTPEGAAKRGFNRTTQPYPPVHGYPTGDGAKQPPAAFSATASGGGYFHPYPNVRPQNASQTSECHGSGLPLGQNVQVTVTVANHSNQHGPPCEKSADILAGADNYHSQPVVVPSAPMTDLQDPPSYKQALETSA